VVAGSPSTNAEDFLFMPFVTFSFNNKLLNGMISGVIAWALTAMFVYCF
jgi:hypothetical protein